MTSFNARSTSEETWWEIQHRYPGHDLPHYREGWATSDLTQFGYEGIVLVRAAKDSNVLRDMRFTSSEAATEFLGRFAQVAELHRTIEFRAVRVHAVIEMESVLTAAPPPICGEYGYYGTTRAYVDLYCQQAPEHEGRHGPRRAAA